MSLWYVLFAILTLGGALALIRALERRAGCPEPDPHEEIHGDVPELPWQTRRRQNRALGLDETSGQPPRSPHSSWRGK